jgi:hypothetical protein
MAMADGSDETAFTGAQGKLVLFLASLFERAGVAPMAEFAALLEMFAQTVGETEPAEAAILAQWARTIGGSIGH